MRINKKCGEGSSTFQSQLLPHPTSVKSAIENLTNLASWLHLDWRVSDSMAIASTSRASSLMSSMVLIKPGISDSFCKIKYQPRDLDSITWETPHQMIRSQSLRFAYKEHLRELEKIIKNILVVVPYLSYLDWKKVLLIQLQEHGPLIELQYRFLRRRQGLDEFIECANLFA